MCRYAEAEEMGIVKDLAYEGSEELYDNNE